MTRTKAALTTLWTVTLLGGSLYTQQSGKPDPRKAHEFKNVYISPDGDDSNDGSEKHPWRTLQRASTAAGAGTVVHAAPGAYGGATTSASGAPEQPLRYVSDVKWGAKVAAPEAKDVWVNRGDWVTIEGFDVTGGGDYGIRQLGSHGTILGNNVHDIPAGTCSSYGGAGIYIGEYAAHDNETIGNIVHDIGDPDRKCSRVHGIYQANRGGRISNNIAYRNNAWGVHLWHAARDIVVSNNLIFENGEGGISVGSGDAPGGVVAANVTVSNNIIVHNGRAWSEGLAIREYGSTGSNRFLNNLVFGNRGGIALKNGNQAIGTITTDPQFVDYRPDGTGDYRLRSDSPARGSGTRTAVPPQQPEGRPGAKDPAPDIGPFSAQNALER